MPEAGECGACAVSRPCPSARTECDFTLRGSVGILLAKSLGKRKDDVLLDAFERHGMLGVEVGLKITKHALDEGFRGPP